MASSREVLVSPRGLPAEPRQREPWADNLRVLVIAVVVVFHTATAYLGGSAWYYMDRTASKAWTTAFFPAYAIPVYALGPLFLVAGWFSARSLAHKGAGAFARSRLLRLGVPLIVFIFLSTGLPPTWVTSAGASTPPSPITGACRPSRVARTRWGRCGSSQRCWPSRCRMPSCGVCARCQLRAGGPGRRSWWHSRPWRSLRSWLSWWWPWWRYRSASWPVTRQRRSPASRRYCDREQAAGDMAAAGSPASPSRSSSCSPSRS